MTPAHPKDRRSALPAAGSPRSRTAGVRGAPRRAPEQPIDSLGYALARATELVAGVIDGANLTEAFERMQAEHPEWPEGTRGAVRDLAWSTLRDYWARRQPAGTLADQHSPIGQESEAPWVFQTFGDGEAAKTVDFSIEPMGVCWQSQPHRQ